MLLQKLEKSVEDMFEEFNHFPTLTDYRRSVPTVDERFVLKDGVYTRSFFIDEGANASNIKVDLDYGEDVKYPTINVEYTYQTDTTKKMLYFSETLPLDSDLETVDAEMKDGQCIISVKQKQEE